MNILTDRLPTAVEIDGKEYEVDTDFRTSLQIIMAFEDVDLTSYEQSAIMLGLLYGDEIPSNIDKAQELAIKFLNYGSDDSEGTSSGQAERLYSFSKDAKYIYSAIKGTHGIDLETVDYLHWWKFCYLFLDLDEDCFFSKIIYYRSQRSRGKLTKEEQEYCAQIKDILDLPKVRTSQEIAAQNEFMELLNRG